MSEEKKIYQAGEAARVAMQTFSPTKNDVLVIHTPVNLDYEQMALFAEQFRMIAESTGCVVMFTTDGAEIKLLSEADMNASGWFRLHDGKIMKGTH